jgi:hypothetical protein
MKHWSPVPSVCLQSKEESTSHRFTSSPARLHYNGLPTASPLLQLACTTMSVGNYKAENFSSLFPVKCRVSVIALSLSFLLQRVKQDVAAWRTFRYDKTKPDYAHTYIYVYTHMPWSDIKAVRHTGAYYRFRFLEKVTIWSKGAFKAALCVATAWLSS